MQKEIFFSAFRIFLNAFSDVIDIPSMSDAAELKRQVREKMFALEKYLEVEDMAVHAKRLTQHFNLVMSVCRPDRECTAHELQACIGYLTEMSISAAKVRCHREVARSKMENSKRLLRKRLDPIDARRETLKRIWASGKFSSRDRCAEEEWEALGFPSFRAARESLNGTPDPTKTR